MDGTNSGLKPYAKTSAEQQNTGDDPAVPPGFQGKIPPMPSAELAIDVIMNTAARRAEVRVRVGEGEALMRPEEARNFGQQLIGAATEAEIQGFLLDWFTKHVGPLDVQQGTALAAQCRQYVASLRKRGPK
jgi:hypothetical protein